MSDLSLLDVSIEAVAAAYRRGTLSPVDVAEEALRTVEATQARLHAFVAVEPERTMAEARHAEEQLRRGVDRGLLQGIPVAIKDIVDVAGFPTRCGSDSRSDAPPAAANATVVTRLRRAGAVVVGKTVTQEFAAGVLSPPARNPWDAERIPGGSSGGSAVAVAVGACLAAVGSDTGGSIRIPAAATGVVGFKPAFGAIPTDGVYPLSWSLDTVGPLARTVRDAELAYHAMLHGDPQAPVEPAVAGSSEPLLGLRIGAPGGWFRNRVTSDVAEAVDRAAAELENLGATIVRADWDDAEAARSIAFIINRAEAAAVHDALRRSAPERFSRLNTDLQLRVVAGASIASGDYLLALRARTTIRDSIARYARSNRLDVLMVPALPAAAARADRPAIEWDDVIESPGTAYTRLTMPFNATGQPVLTVPCGFDRSGLPIGLQLAGRPGGERLLFRIGRAYERRAGWLAQRPPVERTE